MIQRIFHTRLSGLLLILLLFGIWELTAATKLIDMFSWPRFSDVIRAGVGFVLSGDLIEVLVPSLYRLAIGYLFAIVIGVGLGMLMGTFSVVHNLFEPITEVLRPMPSAAMIPILILFMGLGDETKIAIITFAATFPILLNTYSGVKSVDPVQVNTARTLGLNTRDVLIEVVLPASAPYIVAGMRVSLGVALVLVIVAEMLTGGGGLGYFILDTQRTFRVKETYVGIIVIGILGYLLNALFLVAQRLIIGWHVDSTRIQST